MKRAQERGGTIVSDNDYAVAARCDKGVISVGTEYSWPSEVRMRNGTKGTRCKAFANISNHRRIISKTSLPHHLLAVEPDVEIAADAVDVRFGSPVCAGMLGVGMTKRDVDSGNFFVL